MLRNIVVLMVSGLLLSLFAATSLFASPADPPATGQTTVYTAGDDGTFRAGAAWPNPRFTNKDGAALTVGDTVVVDQLTGLMWTRNGAPGGAMPWADALTYVAGLNTSVYLSYNDWRLPNVNELDSILGVITNESQPLAATWLNGQGFSNVQLTGYLSSSTFAIEPTWIWMVDADGTMGGIDKTFLTYSVWPVRGGQSGVINIPKTGQTTVYAGGDDGSLQKGIAPPDPRFTPLSAAGGTVVVDRLSGLSWPQNGSTPTVGACIGGYQTWQDAFAYVTCLNANSYLGYNDWRLPNKEELRSLVNYGEAGIYGLSNWLMTQGFSSVQSDRYWSSSTYVGGTQFAWQLGMLDGSMWAEDKTLDYFCVLPVRGGQSASFAYLTVLQSGNGSGSIIADKGAIIWSGSTGIASYGTFNGAMTVTITATPDPGSTFNGWSGACLGTETCTLTMDGSKTVTANFGWPHITITPSSSAIAAGGSQSYTAEGFDQFNTSLGDVTASTTFSISPDGSCTGSSCTADVSGPHTVTGNNGGKTATASLQVNAGATTAFVITAPGSATGGLAFDIVVTAKDAFSNTVPGYTGTVQFSSTDTQAALPTNYTFVSGDNGAKTFTAGVTLKTAGSITLTAMDTVNNSLTGSANVSVSLLSVSSGVVSGGGTISCSPPASLYGGDFSCNICPSKGYDLSLLSDNGENKTSSCSVNGNCYSYPVTNIIANHTVQATYQNYPVVILLGTNSNTFATIQLAAAAATQNNDRIQVQAGLFTEDVNFDHNGVSASLEGGYDSGFSGPAGETIIQGEITITNGTLTVQDITVQ